MWLLITVLFISGGELEIITQEVGSRSECSRVKNVLLREVRSTGGLIRVQSNHCVLKKEK